MERDRDRDLAGIEAVAVELAQLAGAEIQSALGGMLSVVYKGGAEGQVSLRDPVSEVDRRVEMLIRTRLDAHFPDHGILGEEIEDVPRGSGAFVWAIDPVDGTTNFVNGFPVFSASIGVLRAGRPVIGAIWCAATHALRPGVYHARQGGVLHFDAEPLRRQPNPAVRRHLAGVPGLTAGSELPWETRVTGSAAAECAFVAAGLLRVARFARPNIWDVAAGLALVQAAGGDSFFHDGAAWREFTAFAGATRDLRSWKAPLVIGETAAARRMIAAEPAG